MWLGRGLRRRADNVRVVGEVGVACFGGTGSVVSRAGKAGLGRLCRFYMACRLCLVLRLKAASLPCCWKMFRCCRPGTEGSRTFVDRVMQIRSVSIREDHQRKQNNSSPAHQTTHKRLSTENGGRRGRGTKTQESQTIRIPGGRQTATNTRLSGPPGSRQLPSPRSAVPENSNKASTKQTGKNPQPTETRLRPRKCMDSLAIAVQQSLTARANSVVLTV
jgi:hypothetical protein